MTAEVFTLEQLAERIRRAERRNRRLWIVATIVGSISAVLLCGMSWVALHPAGLSVHDLIVTDSHGKTRARLLEGVFLLMDENGDIKASLSGDKTSSSLRLYGQGKESVSVTVSPVIGAGMSFSDPDGDVRVQLSENRLGAQLSLGAIHREPQAYLGSGGEGLQNGSYLEFYRSSGKTTFAGIRCFESHGCRQAWPEPK